MPYRPDPYATLRCSHDPFNMFISLNNLSFDKPSYIGTRSKAAVLDNQVVLSLPDYGNPSISNLIYEYKGSDKGSRLFFIKQCLVGTRLKAFPLDNRMG